MIYYHFNQTLVSKAHQLVLESLFNQQDFIHSERLLGFSKGRGTAWFLNTQAELGINIVLRHYYRGGLFGKIVKDHYLFRSLKQTRAYQEFELLQKMSDWGLPVPRPVGIQIQKKLFCYQANIMIEKIEQTQDLSKLLQKQALSAKQYQQIGQLIRQLHNKQVHHSDLNIHNILLDSAEKFWLIDFDKCHVEQGNEWKKENLNRLLRSFRKEKGRLNILFDETDWENLLKGYHA